MCPGEVAKKEGMMLLFSKQKYFNGEWEKKKVMKKNQGVIAVGWQISYRELGKQGREVVQL